MYHLEIAFWRVALTVVLLVLQSSMFRSAQRDFLRLW